MNAYRVPGMLVPVRQPTGMTCWAARFTMMLSWQRQQSIPIRAAVSELGPVYLNYFDLNQGLPISDNRSLAATAGMQAEPLMNLTPDGWADLLRRHGLLWTSYGWQEFDARGRETRAGRHIIILYGIRGDGSNTGTTVEYIDPSDGQTHTMTFGQFLGQHEAGFTMRRLSRADELGFSQILHF